MRNAIRAALVAGLTAVATVWPASVMSDTSASPGIRYVALGDSRAAGPNLDPAAFLNGCARANIGYPGLVALALRPTSFTNVACSGARTEHVTSVPQQTPMGPMPPQIDSLTPEADLVTISIGGNNLGWSQLVSPCYTPVPGGDAHCRTDPATGSRMTAALDALGPKVTATLTAIERRAPHARVLLVGHGGIFDNRGCWPNIPTSDADAVWITGFFTRVNRVLAGAAAETGSEFVDVTAGVAGHDACAAPHERWYEGRESLSLAKALHPTAAGMQHIAARVTAAWRG